MTQQVGPAELLLPTIPGGPKEWEPSEALIEQANERHPLVPGLYTDAALRARKQIAAARWFLVRNDLADRSTVTNRKETYLTYVGIERPFCGVEDVMLWFQRETDPEMTTLDAIDALFNHAIQIGALVELSTERAKRLCQAIKIKTRGRVDLWQRAKEMRGYESHRTIHGQL